MKKLLLILSVVLINNINAQDINSGLVAHYTFCGDIFDKSGNDNNGTYFGGTPSFAADRHGNPNQAIDLDGVDDYISVPPSESLNSPVEEITISCWFNYRTYYNNWLTPFIKTNGSEVSSRQYGFGINGATNQIYMNDTYVGISEFLPGQWFHIAITYKNEMYKYYFNGVFVGETEANSPVQMNNLPLEIGRETPVVTEYYDGLIDEIRVYNRELNADEITLLADAEDCSASSINSFNKNDINIYPNPVNSWFKIDSENNSITSLEIFNIQGVLVKQETLQNGSKVDVSSLGNGIYTLKVSTKSGFIIKKLMKL